MKTYSESMGKDPFDWLKALNAKYPDWDNLKERSSKWPLCACGNQCDIIHRYPGGRPTDQELASLGEYFDKYVQSEKSKKALKILLAIEQRSAQLIKELTK